MLLLLLALKLLETQLKLLKVLLLSLISRFALNKNGHEGLPTLIVMCISALVLRKKLARSDYVLLVPRAAKKCPAETEVERQDCESAGQSLRKTLRDAK